MLSLLTSSLLLFICPHHIALNNDEGDGKKMIESDQTKDFFSRRIKQDEVMIEESSREKKWDSKYVRESRKIVYISSCNAHHILGYITGMLRTNCFFYLSHSRKFLFVIFCRQFIWAGFLMLLLWSSFNLTVNHFFKK